MLGKNLKHIRKTLGLTQRQFAEPLGIKGSYISDIEKGKARPSESVIRLLEIKFRVNRKWLESGQGEMLLEPIRLVQDAQGGYAAHGGYVATSLEDFCGVPQGLNFVRAVAVLSDIFKTENQTLIDRTMDCLHFLKGGRAGKPETIGFMQPAGRLLDEVLAAEGVDLDDDERAAVVRIFKREIEKIKNDIAGLIRAFKKKGV